jgi:hypothetical protein
LLTEASKRSRYFIPFNGGNRPTTLVTVLLPHLSPLREAGIALLTRAMIRLNDGDTTGFADDIRAGHRLARLLEQDSTLVGRMVAIGLERRTCRAQQLGIVSGKLSPQQMRQMLDELQGLPPRPSMTDAVDFGERFIGLDFMQALARSDDQGRAQLFNGLFGSSNPEIAFRIWPIDYDSCMRNLNRGYDETIAAMQKPTWPDRTFAFDLQQLRLDLKRREGLVRMMLSSGWPEMMLLPSLRGACERTESAETDANLLQVSLALELFKSEHGEYPQTLAPLQPRYRVTVPVDGFSEKPLIYARSEKGYTLYSVGPDMNDNGGKGDDIVVTMP